MKTHRILNYTIPNRSIQTEEQEGYAKDLVPKKQSRLCEETKRELQRLSILETISY